MGAGVCRKEKGILRRKCGAGYIGGGGILRTVSYHFEDRRGTSFGKSQMGRLSESRHLDGYLLGDPYDVTLLVDILVPCSDIYRARRDPKATLHEIIKDTARFGLG